MYVLITGGTQGLGETTARLFAERGARGIGLVGRNAANGQQVAAELTTEDCETIFIEGDLERPGTPRTAVAAMVDRFGDLDSVVSCAAATSRGSVLDTSPELWERLLLLNVRAPGLLVTEAGAAMKRLGHRGSIVLIGSVAASGGQEFLYPYATSKGALQAMTRNAAYALMRDHIRVNLLQPGWMLTDGEDALQRQYYGNRPDWAEQAAQALPFGRLVEPAEMARAIHFLASDESGLMTGSIIDFDQSVIGAGPPPQPQVAAPRRDDGQN